MSQPVTLYRAWSFVDNFPTRWGLCDHVRMNWFVSSRVAPTVLYETAIEGFDGSPDEATSAIDELFTEAEADSLRQYLATLGTALEVERVELPIPSHSMGLGEIAVGGEDDFYMLTCHDNYPPIVPVWGYHALDDPEVRFHNGRPSHFGWTLCRSDNGTWELT